MSELDKGFDSEAFYKALAATVVARNVTWKFVAEKTGVSPTTLTRMAQGRKPDAASLAVLATWAGLKIDRFVMLEDRPAAEPLAEATAIFRTDPNLSAASKDALTSMLTAAYQSMRGKG
ncbi:helix-turn-helix domain-containing protein [Cupriavidus pauculus]|uniref:helix-turn-helix domain-containing protein n=1 Tax=Cupriavidus pauculus TaxID=82633 RepID=UPI001FD1740B|nr:helix-turn-helix domain-containing protein [Cupriavidus pauculus]